jgi:hypothetical protein
MAFNKVMEKQILTLGVEMMRKTGIFLMLLFIMTSGVVSFAEGSLQNNETKSDTEHIIVFDDLDKIPYQSFSGNDSNGDEYTISISPFDNNKYNTNAYGTLSSNSWLISYDGITIKASFVMTVTNNKCTSAYNKSISTFGGKYVNDILTKGDSHGMLSFDVVGIGGLFQKNCWLKGTVSGNNNTVVVTSDM